jgi:hypothetical protein
VQDDPSSAFEIVILNVLARLALPPSPRLLLLDAMDEGLELDTEAARKVGTMVSFLAGKAARMPTWLRVLATSRNHPGVIGPLRQAFGVKEIDAEEPRNQEDLEQYILARCRREPILSKLQASNHTPSTVADLLRGKSGGKFLYAVRALNDLANGTLGPGDLQRLPPGMDGFYLDAFRRRFGAPPERYEAVREALGILAVAQEPLSPALLAAILGRDEPAVKSALATIPDFIRVRQGRYASDHFSLAEWLTLEDEQFTPRAGPYAVDLPASRGRMRAWALGEVQADRAHTQPYLLRHLAVHLEDSERPAVFARLMRDLHWLEAKPRHAGVHGLLADCALLPNTRASRLMATALRNSLVAVKSDTRQIAPQLLGRLAEHQGLPEIAALCESLRAAARDFAPALFPRTASLGLSSALLATLRGHEGEVRALAVMADGRLVSGGADGTVRVWDSAGRSEPVVLRGHEGGVRALAVLADGRLVSGGDDRTVRVWNTRTGKMLAMFAADGTILSVLGLPNGMIAAGDGLGAVHFLDLIE